MAVDYLAPLIKSKPRQTAIKKAVAKLTKSKIKFETIVGRGVSGIVFATLLAHKMKKNLAIVRKKDGSHSCNRVEADRVIKNYIVVDDLIDTGTTIKNILDTVDEIFRDSKCKAIYLYNGSSSRERVKDIRYSKFDEKFHEIPIIS